jgi:hypothetical protein
MHKFFSDLPAVLSVVFASISLSQVEAAVSILAGIVAIVAGGLAIYRHFKPKLPPEKLSS